MTTAQVLANNIYQTLKNLAKTSEMECSNEEISDELGKLLAADFQKGDDSAYENVLELIDICNNAWDGVSTVVR